MSVPRVPRGRDERAVNQFTGAGWVIFSTIYGMPTIVGMLSLNLTYLVGSLVGGLFAVSVQLAYYRWLIRKFRKPMEDDPILSVVASAAGRAHIRRLPEIWMYNSESPILMSSSNALFSAIVISNGAARDIVRLPFAGEAALAEELLKLPSSPMNGRIKFLFFTIMGTAMFALAGSNIGSSYVVGAPMGPFGVPLILFFLFLCPMIIACPIAVLGSPRVPRTERMVVDLYGIPPQLARAQVFQRKTIDERRLGETLKDYPRNIEEEARRSWRRAKIMSSAAAMTVIVAYHAASYPSTLDLMTDMPAFSARIMISLILGAVAFIVAFFALHRNPFPKIWEFDGKLW